jgi:hypothetical protein
MEFIYSKEIQDLIDKLEEIRHLYPKDFIDNQIIKIKELAIPIILIKKRQKIY